MRQLNKGMLILLLLGMPLFIYGQRTITGTVIEADTGEPLFGVNVLAKETLNGTVTDFDGKYEVTVSDEVTTLVFSYTGFESQEIAIGDSRVIDVTLSSGVALEEVIVIGYGTVKRKDATGSLQSVSSDDFNKGAIAGPQQLLAGKVAGVTITTDGSPGGGSTIRVRGESSLSASNDPLIVIDGVPLDNSGVSGSRNALNVINPNDIESMTVLKDASASAIYGNRAAGGVILITTKKGKIGEGIRLGYNGNVSIGNPSNYVDVLDADEYRKAITGYYEEGHPSLELLGDADTYWQDEIYQQAVSHDHNLNFSGGVGNIPYRVSLGYSDMNGILKTDNFNRLTGSINLTPGFFDNRLQVKLHAKVANTSNHFADRGAIGNSLSFDPTQPIYDSESPYEGFFTWTGVNGNPNTLAPTNPLALLELREDNSDVVRYITNATVDYRFHWLPELRANLNLAYDYSKGSGTVVVPNTASFSFNELTGGGVNNIYEQEKFNSLLEYYMNYKKDFGVHTLDVMAGYSWQHFEVGNTFTNSDAAGTPDNTVTGNDPAEFYLVSLFGRLNYSFTDKYLLTVTLRRDGTSRFAPENRWGLFPAVALGVKLLDNDNQYFNNVKLRAGWGVTGQQEIGDYYAYLARYQLSFFNARYQFGDEYIYTLRPNGYDGNIRWEETTTYNVGLDFSIVKNRVSGTLELYQRFTKDLLNYIPVPAGTNLTNFINTNVGNIENQGIELSLNLTPYLTDKNSWDFAVNVAYNQAEITKLTAIDDPDYDGVLTGGIAGGVGSNIQIHSVGFAPSSFFVYEQLYDDDGNILEGQYADRNDDGLVNDEDKYRFQKPAADYTFGFTSNLNLGNFDFSFAGRAAIGNYVYNNVQTDMGYFDRMYGTTGTLWNVHQSAVDLNVISQSNLTFSDHYVKKANFLRLDHITMGYNLTDLIGHGIRVYATVQNPIVITKYDGLDPEIGNGIDNNIYPRPRTFVFGVNADFSVSKKDK
ncbi:MAG: SusC/RagA family TonB-linked outer membrane protein [Bacteroidetes bacterium]|nr:MAG: SusC/RagA family TonB-linked outer membrane protein [Bacteroidota bacterium]